MKTKANTDASKTRQFECYNCSKFFDSYEQWRTHQRAEHEPTLTFRLLELPPIFSAVKERR